MELLSSTYMEYLKSIKSSGKQFARITFLILKWQSGKVILINSGSFVIQCTCNLLQNVCDQILEAKDHHKNQLNTEFDELLRLAIALATSFPKDLAFLDFQHLKWCIHLLENETQQSKDHLTLSGILLAKTFRAKNGEDWIGMLLSNFQVADSIKLVFCPSSTLSDISFLSLLKGILQVYKPSSNEFTLCLIYHGIECTVREALFTKLCGICSKSSEASSRLLGFSTLAVWFQAFSRSLEEESLISANDIEMALDFIFDEWDDPIDAIPHMLRDTFLAILDIVKNDQRMLATILNRIKETEDSKKVKFDLLTHVISKMGASYLLTTYPSLVDDAFQTLESVPNPVRVVSFITGLLKSSFKEFNLRTKVVQQDLAAFYQDKWWTSKLTQSLLSEKHSVRKIVADSVLPALFKARSDAFEKLSQGISPLKFLILMTVPLTF